MLFIHSLISLVLIFTPIMQAPPNQVASYEVPSQTQLTFVGDIMVHTPQIKSAYNPSLESHDFSPWFALLEDHFNKTDLLIGNLETTLTDKANTYSGFPLFRSPSSLAQDLAKAGFDIMVTANNHSLDGGKKGVETTLDYLHQAGLLTTGTTYQARPPAPISLVSGGISIGLVNATYGTNGLPRPSQAPYMVTLTSDQDLIDQITNLKGSGHDVIIAYIHWGHEYQRKPHHSQKEMVNTLARHGVNVIIGSHPHVIQEDEWLDTPYGRVYVNYSLGNFISNQTWQYADTGLILNLTITKKGDKVTLKPSYLPVWVDKFDQDGTLAYQVIPLLNTPNLKRLSSDDKRRMHQALQDFYDLYPQAIPLYDEIGQ